MYIKTSPNILTLFCDSPHECNFSTFRFEVLFNPWAILFRLPPMFLLMERSSTSRFCIMGSNWPRGKRNKQEQLSKNAGCDCWGKRGGQLHVTWGYSAPLFQFRVREGTANLDPQAVWSWASSHLFSGKDSSKSHLPTNAPSSDVRSQSTSSSVCILLPSWNFWRIRGKFPPTLLFQDKFSSSSSGIASSASPVTKEPKDWIDC